MHPLLIPSLICGLLAALAAGLIGPLVIASRTAALAGAVAHAAVGGIGASLYLRSKVPALETLDPTWGAFVFGLGSALILARISTRDPHTRGQTDTGAAVLWAVGMSLGLLLAAQSGRYGELEGYLFGQIAINGWPQTWQLGALCLLIAGVLLSQGKRLQAAVRDPEHAQLQGARPFVSQALLLGLVAVATVVLTRITGLVLVLALVTLPALAAMRLCIRLLPATSLAIALAAIATTAPRLLLLNVDVSPEPIIVLSAAGLFLLASGLARLRRGHEKTTEAQRSTEGTGVPAGGFQDGV